MNNDVFEYNYSAKEQAEIKSIREKYEKKTDGESCDEISTLRKLDEGVTKKAVVAAMTLGVISTLVLGLGMSIIMTDFSKALNLENEFFAGIVIGVIGLVGVIFSYPLYRFVLKKERNKVAPRIMEITDKLLK